MMGTRPGVSTPDVRVEGNPGSGAAPPSPSPGGRRAPSARLEARAGRVGGKVMPVWVPAVMNESPLGVDSPRSQGPGHPPGRAGTPRDEISLKLNTKNKTIKYIQVMTVGKNSWLGIGGRWGMALNCQDFSLPWPGSISNHTVGRV